MRLEALSLVIRVSEVAPKCEEERRRQVGNRRLRLQGGNEERKTRGGEKENRRRGKRMRRNRGGADGQFILTR